MIRFPVKAHNSLSICRSSSRVPLAIEQDLDLHPALYGPGAIAPLSSGRVHKCDLRGGLFQACPATRTFAIEIVSANGGGGGRMDRSSSAIL